MLEKQELTSLRAWNRVFHEEGTAWRQERVSGILGMRWGKTSLRPAGKGLECHAK